ncbi:MAG: sigma-70 family RNA polymerase sigma factor [Myxococcales bacterium]|jgi:RNA polymerase sigma factor for flagellar operon FliA
MDGSELVARHSNMVFRLARRLRRELCLRGELDDLIAFGFGGLLEAQDRFDPGRGIRFQTFAYHRVRGAMLDGVRKMSLLPRRAHERWRAEREACPTAAPSELDKAFTRLSASLTAEVPLQGRYGDRSPEAMLLRNEAMHRLLSALPDLEPRQRFLVRGHYFEGRPIDAMARELGISKSWASRLHTDALRKLRHAVEAE